MRLDNAAKIYPAARKRNWTALFRMSATLTEAVDPTILQQAVNRVTARFPSFSVSLRHGLFWYYLEHIDGAPQVIEDACCPCLTLRPEDNNGFLFRITCYRQRVAAEFFHVLTDGSGGLCFLKTLVAEYLALKYGAEIPRGGDILDCGDVPSPDEYEDSFLTHAGGPTMSRSEKRAYTIRGVPEQDGFINITCGEVPVDAILPRAREKGVTVTQYLASVLIMAIDCVQRRANHFESRLRPVKICVPVNLRSMFKSSTLRNFSSYVNPGIEPHMGEYDFDEVLLSVFHFMGAEITEKKLRAKFTTNVKSEENLILRIMPLFIKSPVMKYVFIKTGDKQTSSSISNIGAVRLPGEMRGYIERMEFILGPLIINPVCCAALSYGETLYLNFTRTINDPKIEREFFTRLIRLGIPVKISSNLRY
jgi:NRPS condensation-like uncharacterized protein